LNNSSKTKDDFQAYKLPSEEVARRLKSHFENGLTAEEAKKRLKKYGYNELATKEGPTIWERFLEQFKDFLVLILIAASIVSIIVGEVTDSIVILIIVVLNAILGVVQESKAGKALEALKKMAAPQASVIRNGKRQEIPARELVPGDVVILETGDYVPADVRLFESVNLKIEEASLTGESVPVEKDASVVYDEEKPLGDRDNTAYMSTVVTYGRGKGIVVSTGMNTEIGQIAEMLESYEDEQTPLQKKLTEFGKWLGIICLAVVAVVFVLGLLRGEPILEMFMTSISLAVAAIPEGLPAVVTIVLALGMQRMVKRNAIIKKLHAVETLGSTTTICSDKTGTLTQNEMTVVSIYTNNEFTQVTGRGYKPAGKFLKNDKETDPDKDPHLSLLLKIGALCNDAKLEKIEEESAEDSWRIIGDPTEGALVVAASKAGMWSDDLNREYVRKQEIPFDSERKRMTTFHSNPEDKGYLAFVKGAPDIVLDLCKSIYENNEIRELTEDKKARILDANRKMAKQALRVLAVAYKPVEEIPRHPDPQKHEKDLIFVGLLGMIDPARPEAAKAVEVCKSAGIRPIMITGDYRETAVAIAKELKIMDENSKALTGVELDKMDDNELEKVIDDVDVYARVSPQHKVRIVSVLKKKGEITAMTGDGVNDAPALKKADIGVAMGITGTDVAKETAEMILIDDNFASIISAIEEGRIIFSNIRKFVFFLLTCNIAEILVIFLAMVLGWPIPLIPIQILWLNLVTDAFPALALGMEPGEPGIMKQPPRNPDEPILNRKIQRKIIIQSIAMTAATLGIYYLTLQTTQNLTIARTFAFVTLSTSELLRAFTVRSETTSVFELGLFSNKYMLWGNIISFILILMVVYVPFLRNVFQTVPLTLSHWAYILAFAAIPFAAAEIGKALIKNGS